MRKKLIKSEVVNLFNTTKETLRYYEKEGLLQPEIGEKNYRFYDVEDMKTLRQIFMFRDLGFSIEEMKLIFNKSDDLDYLNMLEKHQKDLQVKIDFLNSLREDVSRVIHLLKQDIFTLSYDIKKQTKRYYLSFNPFDTLFVESLKMYYDTFKDMIESDMYIEKELVSIFEYKELEDYQKENSSVGIEITSLETAKAFNDVEWLSFEEGDYLSVLYIFEEGRFDELHLIKENIDEYLLNGSLEIAHPTVLEIEHPEFNVVLGDNKVLYEIQIQVKRIR